MISILVPTTLERQVYLEDLLADLSVQQNVKSAYEVLVIENRIDHKPLLTDLLQKWKKDLSVRNLIVSQDGLHYARHAGARAANGELLIYVDDDVRMDRTWLSTYNEHFQKKDTVCAGGKVVPEWDAKPPDWVQMLSPNIFSLLDYGGVTRELSSKEGINGCNFAILKSTLYKYHGFHPDGFALKEHTWLRGDGEYGLVQKIKAGGESVHYLPEAFVYHRIPQKRISYQSIEQSIQNHAISSAYTFTRKSKNLYAASIALVTYGYLLGFITKISNSAWRTRNDQTIYGLLKLRYRTFAEYGFRLLRNTDFRQYVTKKNYLEN